MQSGTQIGHHGKTQTGIVIQLPAKVLSIKIKQRGITAGPGTGRVAFFITEQVLL